MMVITVLAFLTTEKERLLQPGEEKDGSPDTAI
jgi:hypothetical protein